MKNNDLSNELTKRIIVTADVFSREEPDVKKILGVIPVVSKKRVVDIPILSRLYLFADRSGTTLELATFDMSNEEADLFIEELDEIGSNPFRYHAAYGSPEKLSAQLPYRPEVRGVLDLPQRLLAYGHWGMDMSQL